jgi:hypothetical protein
MKMFQPEHTTFWQKIFLNPLFHISIFLVGVTVFSSFYFKGSLFSKVIPSQNSMGTINSFSNPNNPTPPANNNPQAPAANPQEANSNPNPAAPAAAAETTPQAAPTAAAAAAVAPAPIPTPVAAPTPPETTAAPEKPLAHNNAATDVKKEGLKITAYFVEVKSEYLQKLIDSSKNFGQYDDGGDFPFGLMTNLDSKLKRDSSQLDILEVKDGVFDSTQNSLQWFFGKKATSATEGELGLHLMLNLTESEPKLFKGEVSFQRTWLDNAANDNKKYFEVNDQQAFYLANILPRNGLKDRDGLFNSGLFKIMKSSPFKESQSELVIFFKIHK